MALGTGNKEDIQGTWFFISQVALLACQADRWRDETEEIVFLYTQSYK